MRFIIYTALSLIGINALDVTPIRAILADEDYLLRLCVGNLLEAKVPGKHQLADVKLNLRNHKKVHCGPDNTIKAKSLLDLLLLGDDACNHLKILDHPATGYGEGVGGIDIILQTIQPHCSKDHPHILGTAAANPPAVPPSNPQSVPATNQNAPSTSPANPPAAPASNPATDSSSNSSSSPKPPKRDTNYFRD